MGSSPTPSANFRHDVPGREMIEINMEMLPFGYETGRYQIAKIVIVNDATGDLEVANYDVTVYHPTGIPEMKLRIEKFPRRLQIFGLLKEILDEYERRRMS